MKERKQEFLSHTREGKYIKSLFALHVMIARREID